MLFAISEKIVSEVDKQFAKLAIQISFAYLVFMLLLSGNILISSRLSDIALSPSDTWSTLISTCLTLLSYIFARTRFAKYAPAILILGISQGIIVSSFGNPDKAFLSYIFIAIPCFLSAIFYTFYTCTMTIAVFACVVATFMGLHPEHNATVSFVLPFNFISISIFLIFQFQRKQELEHIIAGHQKQRALEKELQIQRANSLERSKLSALGEMAGAIAHEINNPLLVIKMTADQILRLSQTGDLEQSKIAFSVKRIDQTVDRIAKIVQGLRIISRDGTQDAHSAVSTRRLIEDTLSFCMERFKNHDIELMVDPVAENIIECRQVQIMQVLLNMLSNAFDAVSQVSHKVVRLSVKDFEDSVSIVLCDSGPGIPKEIREQIMLPFFTTKEVGKGTGIGLSISKAIAEEHGGKLYLDESADETTFVLQLKKRRDKRLGGEGLMTATA